MEIVLEACVQWTCVRQSICAKGPMTSLGDSLSSETSISPKTVVDLLITCDAASGPTSDSLNRNIPPCVLRNLNFFQRIKRDDQEQSRGAPNTADDPSFTTIENQDWTNRQWLKPDGVPDLATHYRIGFATNPQSLQAIRECIFPPRAPGRDPLASPPIVQGTWASIRVGHELVSLGPGSVLDWVPSTSDFRVWKYDRQSSSGDPLPSPPLQKGKWRTIGTGHQLIYLDGNQILDWIPDSGQYRIFHFKSNQPDPLPGPPKLNSKWSTIIQGHVLLYCGQDMVLDWEPGNGNYRVWMFDSE